MKKHSINVEAFITTDDIINLLSMECDGFDYWAEIRYNKEDYEAAWKRLVKRLKNEKKHMRVCKVCHADVCAEILENGGKLIVHDLEEDKDYELTLQLLLDGFARYMKLTSVGRVYVDDMDSELADQILQITVFGREEYYLENCCAEDECDEILFSQLNIAVPDIKLSD